MASGALGFAGLAAFGRHLVAGAEGEQPVYRIAHQQLVDYVKGNILQAVSRAIPPRIVEAVGTVILTEYERLLNAGLGPRAHTYLWRHAWRHLAGRGRCKRPRRSAPSRRARP